MTYNNSINSGVTGILNATSAGAISGVILTQYNVLVGSTGNSITSVAPSSTSGVPLVSNGSSANPSFTTAVVGGGGTGANSFTAYMPVCAGTTSTNPFQSVATGTTNYVLQSGGSSALPSWVSTSGMGGSLVLIQSQTATTASSLAFTSGITSTYNNYLLIAEKGSFSAATPILVLQLSSDGGSTYDSSSYNSGTFSTSYSSVSWNNNNTTTGFELYKSAASGSALSVSAYLANFTSGSQVPSHHQIGANSNTTGSGLNHKFGTSIWTGSAITVNAFQLLPSTGTFNGIFHLYGILE